MTTSSASSGRLSAGARQLVFTNDAVSKAVFMRGRSHDAVTTDNRRFEVLASGKGIMAGVELYQPPGMSPLGFLDRMVMAAVSAVAERGEGAFAVADLLRLLGYENPHAGGMGKTSSAVIGSLDRLASARVRLAAVPGGDGKPWLDEVPASQVAALEPTGGAYGSAARYELRPPDPARPLTALPFLMRADQAGQVVGISQPQMPSFAGRRVSLQQRCIACYLTIRAMERLPVNRVLVDTLLRDVGISFGPDGAGRQARARAMRQLTATLESMAAQGTVIDGFNLEREGRRIRAISLSRPEANTKQKNYQ